MHEKILGEVLTKIKPRPEDLIRLNSAVEKLIRKIECKARELGIGVKVRVVGSAARNTWLKGEKDIDILLMFPESMPEEEMERLGIRLAREVAGSSGREEYAEHPYIRATFDGLEVDIVPCFEVSDPSRIKSAVDRTPHHQEYIRKRMTDKLADQVLLLKQFTRGIGVYGAESKVQGFSGYLCELLILHYGSFMELVRSASEWHPGTVIDIEGYHERADYLQRLFAGQPLIVIDPVDRKRNVAAAVSLRSFGTFVHACRDFLRLPRMEFFFPHSPPPVTVSHLRRILKLRGTRLIFLLIHHGGLSEEVLYPQLRKTARAIQNSLVQRGFSVIRSGVVADERDAGILLEVSPRRLPGVETRLGPRPPVDPSNFIETYISSERRISGPMVNDAGNLIFEIRRTDRDPVAVVKNHLSNCTGFGKDLAELVQKRRFELLADMKVSRLLRKHNFKVFLSDYFDGRLPWYR
jgi:tRNA nucleotidyltransferase (CCA-adding enzyme)